MTNRITDHIRLNVVAYVALFLVLTGGVAWANHPGGADTISSGDIINNEVKSVDLANGEVKNDDLGANAVGSGKIADQSVKNADLSIGASSSNTIADGGIQNVDVANNTLTGAKVDESTLFNDNSLTGGDIDESTLSGLPSANAWNLDGNSGTTGADFLGTTDNNSLNLRVNNARALRLEPASDGTNQSPNVIGGIADNSVAAGVHSATIGGGGRSQPGNPATANEVTDNYGTVGGGANNQAGDGSGAVDDRRFATVGGGRENTASRFQATVGGGAVNTAGGDSATVGGGSVNTASGGLATVAGGFVNAASGDFATVPGGDSNTAAGVRSFAAGNRAKANHDGAFVWADSNPFDFASTAQDQLNVRSTGGARLASGIDGSGSPTSGLKLPANTSGWSTLVSGQPFDVRVNGARGLRVDPASDGSNQSPNVIGGIADNTVTPGVHSAVIGGGGRGTPSDPATANRVTDHQGTVDGGANNQAGDGTGTVGDATLATVGGGGNNTATGEAATVGGGFFNSASGKRASVPGGDANVAAGDYSFAAGRAAKANHEGAFVWADSITNLFGTGPEDFTSTAQNQFSVRATGGARFVSAVDLFGDPTAGVSLAPGGGSWSSLSDEASKRAIEPTSGLEVLRKLDSVPISTWSYRSQDDSVRHIGPMAQDFFRAFGVGENRRHISTVDADGVALAAIKGLSRKLREERRRRHELEARVAALERGGR
jgi:hypothetical protein